jgi:hypothetical protein
MLPVNRRQEGTMAGAGRSPGDTQVGRDMTDDTEDDTEIAWHREQIVKNRTILEELEAGNTAGGDVFPETQSEIEHLKAQIAQSELIVAASEKASQ